MSANNIYDTFLSLKITPDSKNRLEEIRNVTETILRNRDNINKMKDELEDIDLGKGASTADIAQMMELARQGNPLANFLKFKDPISEKDIGRISNQKLENLAAKWKTDKDTVKQSILEMGNILRGDLMELIQKGETTTPEYYDILRSLNTLTSKGSLISATEINRIVRMVLGKEEEVQARLFRNYLGGGTGRLGKTTPVKYRRKQIGSISMLDPRTAPARPNTTREMTEEGLTVHKKYVAALQDLRNNQMDMSRSERAELLKISDQYSMASEADKGQFVQEFTDKLASILGSDKISLTNILPLDFPKQFWDAMIASDLVDEDYKTLIEETLTRSVVDMRFVVYDAKDFQKYVKQVLRNIKNKEAKRYLERIASEQQERIEQEGIEGAYSYAFPFKVQGQTVSQQQQISDAAVGIEDPYVFFNTMETSAQGIKVLLHNESRTMDNIQTIQNSIDTLMERLKNVSEVDNINEVTDAIMKLQATVKEEFRQKAVGDKTIRGNIP